MTEVLFPIEITEPPAPENKKPYICMAYNISGWWKVWPVMFSTEEEAAKFLSNKSHFWKWKRVYKLIV